LNTKEIDRRLFLKTCLAVSAATGLTSCRSTPSTKPAQNLPKTGQNPFLYTGTYAGNDASSIFIHRMDSSTGALESVDAFKAGANPSFLALNPDGRFLYAVNEWGVSGPQGGSAVSAFAVDPQTGRLTLLNRQSSGGSGPCHVNLDRTGKFVLVANYGSGSLAVLPVREDGGLESVSQTVQHTGHGPVAGRQEGPHAHYITASPDNRFVLACDLGIDRVLVYGFDATAGGLTPAGEAVLPPGSGPRHLDFHPSGRHVYVLNELTATMAVFSYAAETGSLTQLQILSALPDGYSGSKSGAEVFVHPAGKFVYGSNRGHDSMAIFAVEESTGRLTLSGHESTRGRTPRSFAIDPTGAFLLAANQDGNSIAAFRINGQTGGLAYLSTLNVPKPVCLKFRSGEAQP